MGRDPPINTKKNLDPPTRTWYRTNVELTYYYVTVLSASFFSSPELKAQVSYSDRLLSVICLLDFYIFDFFSRTAGPIVTKVGTNDP
jgi:hypothetical protein